MHSLEDDDCEYNQAHSPQKKDNRCKAIPNSPSFFLDSESIFMVLWISPVTLYRICIASLTQSAARPVYIKTLARRTH